MSIQTVIPNINKIVNSLRFIALEAITYKFIQKFGNNFFKMKKGGPMGPTKELGFLNKVAVKFQLKNQVKSSVDEGAKVLLGGKPAGRKGAFMKPILTGPKPVIAAYHEQLFAPVASFYVVKDEQVAINLADDSDFGLVASAIPQDNERRKKIANQISMGMVFVNHLNWTQASLLFGGTKSGFGHELSELGIHKFVNKN